MPEAASLYVRVQADVSQATAGLQATQVQLSRTASAAKAMDAAMMTSGSTTRKVGAGYAAAGAAAAKTERQMAATTAAASGAAASQSRLSRASSSAKAGLSGLGMGATGAQMGVMGLAYGFGKSIKSAADFDSAMRNVNSLAGLSEGKFQQLKSSVLNLAGPTAQAPQTLAEGLYDLVSSGFSSENALKVLKASSYAATAGLTDTGTAAKVVAGAINAYGLSADQAGQVSDDLFQTVNVGVLTFEDLAQGIGPVIPAAKGLGISLKEVGATTATLTKRGIPAAEAFTYQKGAMMQMIKPSKDLEAAYKKLGVASGSELIRKSGGFQAALESLWRVSGKTQQGFAKLFPDVRGLTAAMNLTGSGAQGARRDLALFNDTAGQTMRVFKEQSQGQGFTWKKLSADAKVAAVDLGNQFAPAAKKGGAALDFLFGIAHRNSGAIATYMKGLVAPTWGLYSAAKMAGRAVATIKPSGTPESKLVSNTTTVRTIKINDSDAVAKIQATKRGIFSIPQLRNIRFRVVTDADIVKRKMYTALQRDARPVKVKTEWDRRGNAMTTVVPVKPKPVRITADARPAKNEAKNFVESVNGLKPKKTKIDANASQAKNQVSSLKSMIAGVKDKTVTITVNTKKTSGRATGGRVNNSLVEVNERGPEAVRYPDGSISMLGDGRRMVTALPVGSWVYTAAQTRAMQGLASGGKVKADDRANRMLEELDYRNATGRLTDKDERRRLRKALDAKGKGSLRRSTRFEIKRRLYELNSEKSSRIKDLRDQEQAIGLGPVDAADIAIKTANRHIKKATKAKDSEALAQAKLELKQAQQQKDEALKAKTQAEDDAKRQLADAIKANTDELAKNRQFAERVHTARSGVTDTTIGNMLDGTLGGMLTEWVLTNSPRWSS